MKKLLFIAIAFIALASTSNRMRTERSITEAAAELGISTDSLMRQVAELDELAQQLNDTE